MPLDPGEKFGPYEILAPLGAGGMGEVYKARDTKLKREVAIKVLPQNVADDVERLARFEREATVLAALNHPNIAHVYGLEESNGVRALVMELIPGQTLRGPLPLEEVLRLAGQIADALGTAHDKGITHRDLKPLNVMITPEGSVKVLDFGLASVMEAPAAATGDLSQSPTMTLRATQAGMILGTAEYMSPEQARGHVVDRRADIWAFGVVLYELSTGSRPFQGADISEILASVIKDQPDLEPVPAELRRLLRKCLEKDPKKRLRDIGDWRELLEDGAQAAPPVSGGGSIPWAIAALATVLLAAVSWIHFGAKAPELPVIRTSLLPPEGATWDRESLAISPDGRRIAFTATAERGRRQIWVRSLDSMVAQPVAGTEDASSPAWSPDGKSLTYVSQGTINRIIPGGSATPVLSGAGERGGFRGWSWTPDGTILYAPAAQSALMTMNAAGVPPTAATVLRPGEVSHRHPSFLPDGRHFVFAEGRPGAGNRMNSMNTWFGSLDSQERQKLFTADSAAVFTVGPDGREYLLYVRDTTLVAQRFDSRNGKTTGEAAAIAEGVLVSPASKPVLSVSQNGILLFAERRGDDQLVWWDRKGKRLDQLPDMGEVVEFRLSPDGKTIAYESRGDIWLYDLERRVRSRLTAGPARDLSPMWSPDGRTVYFTSIRDGEASLYRKALTGMGGEEEIVKGGVSSGGAFSPDGKFLAFSRSTKGYRRVWILPDPGGAVGKSAPYELFQDLPGTSNPAWSPDGRWLAFASSETGRAEVYAAPFPGPGAKVRISTSGYGGTGIHFSRDGRQVLFGDAQGQATAVDIVTAGGQLKPGEAQVLFSLPSWFEVSPDGNRLLGFERRVNEPVTLVQNWTGALVP